MFRIEVEDTDTDKIKALIEEANRLRSRYVWTGPSLEKYELACQIGRLRQSIASMRRALAMGLQI